MTVRELLESKELPLLPALAGKCVLCGCDSLVLECEDCLDEEV